MIIARETLDGIKPQFEIGNYWVIINPLVGDHKPVDQNEAALTAFNGVQSEPNYVVVNTLTGAIEFAVDQLPAAIDVSMKLNTSLTETLDEYRKNKLATEIKLARSN